MVLGRRQQGEGERAESGQRRRRLRHAARRDGPRLPHRSLRVHLEVQEDGGHLDEQ